MPGPVRISVDGMGGDFAPQNIVSGCVQAASEFDVQVLLVGREDALRAELEQHDVPNGRIQVVPAPDVVAMDERATSAVRRKRHSSLRVAVDLASKGDAEGIVSAGNTGAMYAMVKLAIGTLPGVDRSPYSPSFFCSLFFSIATRVRHLLFGVGWQFASFVHQRAL